MATQTIKTTFQLRRGLKDVWERNNPVLAYGEPGFEKDTYRLKIGDGVTAWNDLGYLNGSEYSVEPDGKSITLNAGLMALYGFTNADVGQIPSKGAEGTIEWINRDQPLTEEEIREVIGEGE